MAIGRMGKEGGVGDRQDSSVKNAEGKGVKSSRDLIKINIINQIIKKKPPQRSILPIYPPAGGGGPRQTPGLRSPEFPPPSPAPVLHHSSGIMDPRGGGGANRFPTLGGRLRVFDRDLAGPLCARGEVSVTGERGEGRGRLRAVWTDGGGSGGLCLPAARGSEMLRRGGAGGLEAAVAIFGAGRCCIRLQAGVSCTLDRAGSERWTRLCFGVPDSDG